jgi:hypothetical protein
MIYITLHTTLKIEQHEHHKNPGELINASTGGTSRVTDKRIHKRHVYPQAIIVSVS